LPAGWLVEVGAALSIIERGARLQPAMIDMISDVAKNKAPRIAVARVGLAASGHEAAAPANAQRAAFRALQEHHPDKGDDDQEVNDNEDGLHLLALNSSAACGAAL
jgi:hypothetical protein